jgi:hypothetical protein
MKISLKGGTMFKKLFLALLALFFVFSTVGLSFATDKGNKRKGKYTYRKVYKACFERGEIDSKVPPISPADKTQAEWTSIFESKEFNQFGCEDEWQQLSETDVTDIYTYMHDHASDSPTPAKCK